MKKLVSFLMVALMLTALLAMSVSAEQTCQDVTIPKFTAAPSIDGVVSVEEWGEKTLRMVTAGAATETSEEIGYNEEYGLKNTFYYYALEGFCDGMGYDLWIRWDDEFFYIAAIVDDPDPFSLPVGGYEIWNGDCFQFYIEAEGPSAGMLASNPDWNWREDAYDGELNKPWHDPDAETLNVICGLVQETDADIWRAGPNYTDGWSLTEDGGKIGIGLKKNDDDTNTITYEAAVPWTSVDATLVAKAGDIFGFTCVAAASDADGLNAWLQWGHGVMSVGNNNTQPVATRGGSQAVILGEDTVTPADDYPEAGDPDVDVTEDPGLDDPDVTTQGGLTPPPVVTTAKDDAPSTTVAEGGLPTGAIIGIVAGVLVVVAVVVVIIVKKKK